MHQLFTKYQVTRFTNRNLMRQMPVNYGVVLADDVSTTRTEQVADLSTRAGV